MRIKLRWDVNCNVADCWKKNKFDIMLDSMREKLRFSKELTTYDKVNECLKFTNYSIFNLMPIIYD